MKTLTDGEIKQFKKHGFLVKRDLIDAHVIQKLPQWINELSQFPLEAGKQMVYLEDCKITEGNKVISRMEKFIEEHQELRNQILFGPIINSVSQLLGEEAILFKEKVNFQPPYGGGILPHQDIQAGWLDYADTFISVAVTIDESTAENGCTEIDFSWNSEGLVGNLWEPIKGELLEKIKFQKVPTQPGDVIYFDGLVPHRALANQTDQYRRIMFITYNPKSQGQHRDQYFADKRTSYPPDNERAPGKEYTFRV